MPLYQTVMHAPGTEIYVWEVTESYEDLFDEVRLTDHSLVRLRTMKSDMQQKAFLGVRKLLQHIGLSDFDMYYDAAGKPHLHDGRHISISHSFHFASMIVSDKLTGLDMEQQREKIKLIAHKFAATECPFLDKEHADYIRMLTVIWGAKEAVFKIRNEEGISFKDHITVAPFKMADGQCETQLHFKNIIVNYRMFFLEVSNYILVYGFEN